MAEKSFYYDAFPPDGHPTLGEKEAFLERIASLSGWHVNPGISRRTAKGLRQKGVDVKLAVDAINHRVRGNMDRAILFAGDLDFLPLINALIELGTWVQLWCDPVFTPKELRMAADEVEYLSIRSVFIEGSGSTFSIKSTSPPSPRWEPAETWPDETCRLQAKGDTSEFRVYGDKTKGLAVRRDTIADRIEFAEWHHSSAVEQGYYLRSMEPHLPWEYHEAGFMPSSD